MPRFDGEVFRFGTAIAVTPSCDFAVRKAAYRRTETRTLGHDPEKWSPVFGKDHAEKGHDPEKWARVFGKDHAEKVGSKANEAQIRALRPPYTGIEPAEFERSPLVEFGETAHQHIRNAGAAAHRVGQDCREFRRLGGGLIARRFAEGPTRAGLGAKFAIRTPLRNVEVDFENPALGQHHVEPQRQRELERLADKTAALPQEQIFGGLLRDRGCPPRLAEFVRLLHRLADRTEVDAAIAAKSAVLRDDDGEAQRRRNAI